MIARFADRAAFGEKHHVRTGRETLQAAAEQRSSVAEEVTRAVRDLPGGEELHVEMTTNVAIARS